MTVKFRFCGFYRVNPMMRAKFFVGVLPISASECRKYFSKPSVFVKKTDKEHINKGNRGKGLLLLGALTASAGGYFLIKKKIALAEKSELTEPGKFIATLPVYTESDLANHKTKENKIWVTYKNGVYDVTDYVEKHPGGQKILLAAGSSVEPFWAVYGVHHSQEVYRTLEKYRIGNIEMTQVASNEKLPKYFEKEPKRHPALIPASLTPYNAETPGSLLVDNFLTPNSIFYVRNHLPVPEVDVSKYRLEVSGIGVQTQYLTLAEVKKFPKYTITAAVQCAGNRRSDMTELKPVKGLNWKHGAIGNAKWAGARLVDVLEACELNTNRGDIEHVHFEGLDKGPDQQPYGASIPVEKALNPKGDVLLAYEMNGEPLSRDHGFPIRVIVPGVVGARNVKWLSKIVVSDKESPSHWQQNDYKGFSPSTDWHNVDFSQSPAIQELPVISAICMPENGEKVEPVQGYIICKGYAFSGDGKRIVRVDVTADKGKTWHVANLEQSDDKTPRHWGWSIWTVEVPVPKNQQTLEIWAKAVDSSYNTQPENIENIWNLRGVLSNAYHKIKVTIQKS